MSPLDSLANELRMHICSFLRPYDLWVLMRVNRAFHSLIEPMLYSKMELHRPGYHEHYQYPDAIHSGERRNYHENDAGDYPEYTFEQDWRYTAQAFDFLKVFENPDGENIQPCVRTSRSQAIANQVRFLCLETDLYHDEQKLVDPWGTIASFRNIEHLELTVGWPCDYKDWDSAAQAFALMDHPPLEKLRTVRLRGYLPKDFVRYVCQGATGITDLELALLDRPIGSSNYASERKNPPPGWKHIEPEIDGDAWLDGEDEDTASDKDSDGEDFENEECVAPRALPTLLDSGIDLAAHFSSLTRLTLRRPAESLNPGSWLQGVYVSLQSDLAILSEWAALIRATRDTLVHLVLDQRPFAEEIETDSTGDTEFLVCYPYGPGYERFAEHCLPALLEEIEWPNLKCIRLYGFDVPPEMAEKHSSPVKAQKLGLQVEARFKPLGVDVRVGRVGRGGGGIARFLIRARRKNRLLLQHALGKTSVVPVSAHLSELVSVAYTPGSPKFISSGVLAFLHSCDRWSWVLGSVRARLALLPLARAETMHVEIQVFLVLSLCLALFLLFVDAGVASCFWCMYGFVVNIRIQLRFSCDALDTKPLTRNEPDHDNSVTRRVLLLRATSEPKSHSRCTTMSPLDSLANELRMHICSFLRPHYLVALMRVNRAFHSLIEPMLYSRMELHRPGYHEHYQYPDAISSGERRNYHENDDGDYPEDTFRQDWRCTAQAFDFLKVFENPNGDNIQPCVRTSRSQAIANQVRFLCLGTDLYHDDQKLVDPWGTIASFRNIEHLELTVGWPYEYKDWDSAAQAFASMDHPPLDKLRTVRLRGYLPKEFVRYICQGATGITDLELALLDRPIGSSNANERKNPPPGWKHIESEVDGDTWLDGENEDTASDKDSDTEDFEQECVAPRALPTLLDSDIDLAAHFSSLTRLTLRRPAESLNPGVWMQGVYVSLQSDLAILSEWAALIRATRGTLAHLVLDQRPFAEEIETDATGDTEFLVYYPYGPGYERFVEYCLPALLEETAEWPSLKSIHLYGFDVPPERAEKYSSPIKPQKLGLQVEARFKPRGVDVRSGIGRRMLYEDNDGVVRPHGDGLGGRVEEEEE